MLPIPHLSYSALKSYLSNRQAFYKRYIRGEKNEENSTAMNIGTVMHAYMEHGLSKGKPEAWDPQGKKFMEMHARLLYMYPMLKKTKEDEKYATPESWANMIIQKGVTLGKLTMDWWTTRNLNVIATEQESYGEHHAFAQFNDGQPLRLKAIVDAVCENGVLIDWKTVSTFSDPEIITIPYLIQAYFCLRAVEGSKHMIFVEVKKSENRDKSPRIQEIVVSLTEVDCMLIEEIIRRVCSELTGVMPTHPETGLPQFLPNPFAQYGAEASWRDFSEEIFSL